MNALNHGNRIPIIIDGHDKATDLPVLQFFYSTCVICSGIQFRIVYACNTNGLNISILVFIELTGIQHLYFKGVPSHNTRYNAANAVLHLLLPHDIVQ